VGETDSKGDLWRRICAEFYNPAAEFDHNTTHRPQSECDHHAALNGRTHCNTCGGHRGLSMEVFVTEAPPLTPSQVDRISTLFRTGSQR
jgi:hypothetical protein